MRNYNIDVMKGLGILLVVLSHAIVKGDPTIVTTYNNGLFNIVSAFFMPMFFAISGYLVYGRVGNWEWVKKHTIKWLIPIAILVVFYWGYNQLFPNLTYFFSLDKLNFSDYMLQMIGYGFSGSILWFLWVFICCHLLAYVLEQCRIKIKIPFAITLVVFILLVNIIPVGFYFGALAIKWYGIFFFVGYAVHHYKPQKHLAYLSLMVFPACIYLLDWLKPYENARWGSFGLASLITSSFNGHAWLVGLIFMMAILGTLFIFTIADLIRWKPLVSIISYLGVNSIGIYLLHILFIGISHNVWLSAFLATIISVGLYEILKRIKFTNFILFGGEPIKIRRLGGWHESAQEKR